MHSVDVICQRFVKLGLSTTYHVYVFGERAELEKFAAAARQLELGASLSLATQSGATHKHTEGAARVGTKGPSLLQAFTFTKGTQIGAGVSTEVLRVNPAGNAEFYDAEHGVGDLLGGVAGTSLGARRPHLADLYRKLDDRCS
eukprot:jgi/Mesvir1/391/Mv11283-RA.1